LLYFAKRMNALSFEIKGQKVQGHDGSTMLEDALLAFLTQYLENYWTEFHQTFIFDAVWDKYEHFSFGDQKVKRQGHSKWRHTELNAVR